MWQPKELVRWHRVCPRYMLIVEWKTTLGIQEWKMGALPAGVISKAFMGKWSSLELCRMSGIWPRDWSASVFQWPQVFQMYCRKYSNAVGYRVGLTLGAVGKSGGKKTTELCNVVGSHPRDHPIQGDRSALISRLTGVYCTWPHTSSKAH